MISTAASVCFQASFLIDKRTRASTCNLLLYNVMAAAWIKRSPAFSNAAKFQAITKRTTGHCSRSMIKKKFQTHEEYADRYTNIYIIALIQRRRLRLASRSENVRIINAINWTRNEQNKGWHSVVVNIIRKFKAKFAFELIHLHLRQLFTSKPTEQWTEMIIL